MIKLLEPARGVAMSKALFARMQSSALLLHRLPILADIFVFSFPIYLLALYIYGMITKKMQYKTSAIFIFCGTALTTIINIFIQFFVDKARPDVVLGLVDLKTESILHRFLPSSSFPSDHAAMSMGIAFASIARGVKNKDKKYLRFGGVLIIFSLIMIFSRMATAIHRPTDLIAGSVIGIAVPWILLRKPLYRLIERVATWIGKII